MPAADGPSREHIGPYRIVARVGAGGMGEVFKAWDPRLEREVAIKLLHADVAADPDHQRRLIAEGRSASALNHPNILRVYDADVDGDSYYLVSEWLEGKSLRDELSRGPLPIKRLLDLAVQIADGLAAAHAIGIVHRDIKPDNVMLARDGTARIVDFGLARVDPHSPARATAATHASTITLENGLSGTPAYMSPEQARGQLGDFRTDQFSFGVLLDEMATGKQAFRRDSLADTLSAVLNDEPQPVRTINPRVPTAVAWIVEQCMAKDAGERYAATEDLAREFRRVRERLRETVGDRTPERSSPARAWLTAIAAVAASAVVTLALAMPLQRPTPDLRFTPIASAAEYEGEPAFSLDGESLAYVADVGGVLQVFVRRLGDAVSHQVTRMRFDAHRPFWAPNGKLVYFISLAGDREALWSVGVAGGVPELIMENVTLAAIDPMEQRLALMRVAIATELRASLWWSSPPGSEPVRESRPPFDRLESVASQLSFNRAGDLLIWASGTGGQMEASQPLNSFYLFDRSGRAPRRVLMNVPRPVNLPAFAWLADNRHLLVALPDDRLGNRHLWMADTRSDSLRQLTATHTNETTPAASLRGPVAFATDEVDFDLVRISADGRTREGFVSTARNEFSPAWSPTGDQFAFITDRSGALEIWARSRDGQWERPVVGSDDFPDAATESMGSLAYSPDGKTLAFQRSASGRFEIWLAPVAGGAPMRLIDSEPGDNPYQDSPSWSPDGAWIAFTQANTDRERQGLKKVRVGTKDIIGIAGDVASFSQSRWSPDGRWILCQLHAGLARVPADGGASEVFAAEAFLDFVWAPDSRHVFALSDSDTPGHFALIEIDSANGETRVLNGDLGTVPIANQPIRGFSFAQGHGFLTSLASARSDIWLIDGFEVPSRTFLRWFGR